MRYRDKQVIIGIMDYNDVMGSNIFFSFCSKLSGWSLHSSLNHVGNGWNAAWLYNTEDLAVVRGMVFYCFYFFNLMQLSSFAFPDVPQTSNDFQIIWQLHETLLTFSQAPSPKKRKPLGHFKHKQTSFSSCFTGIKDLKNDNKNNNHIYSLSIYLMAGTALGPFIAI